MTIAVYIDAGSRYEPDAIGGVSHLIEHMLFKGTRRYPTAYALSAAVDRVGGLLNAETDRELTVYSCKVPAERMCVALDVLADMVQQPCFDPEEFERERSVVLEELASVADHPGDVAEQILDELLWPNHPLGREIAGTPESVRALALEQAIDYFHERYVAGNAVVSVAGPLPHELVEERAARAFGGWRSGSAPPPPPAPEPLAGLRLGLRTRNSEQAHILLAVPGLPTRHPLRIASDLVSAVYGEAMSSRLFVELREQRALCYEVGSSNSHLRDTGSFVSYAAVAPERLDEAVAALRDELLRLRAGLEEHELAHAREMTHGRIELRMEDTRSLAGWAGAQLVLNGRVREVDEILAEVDAVTVADTRRVAERLVRPELLRAAVVGPLRSRRRLERLLGG